MTSRDETLRGANATLAELNIEQRKWVLARLRTTSDAAAARAIGLHPTTISRWSNKAELEEIMVGLLADPIQRAIEELSDALPEAVHAKREGLKSRNEVVKQAAASDIMDRVMGRPVQRQEVTGAEGGPVIIAIGGIDPDNDI